MRESIFQVSMPIFSRGKDRSMVLVAPSDIRNIFRSE